VTESRPLPQWLLLALVGLSVALSAAALVVALTGRDGGHRVALAVPTPTSPVSVAPNVYSPPTRTLPHTTLAVFSDGCGVVRGAFPGGDPQALQWSVTDAGGFEVLGRNAQNETRYRFYQHGSFSVVLKAFDGAKYVDVSNAVHISC
jgi:hypothetical protein